MSALSDSRVPTPLRHGIPGPPPREIETRAWPLWAALPARR